MIDQRNFPAHESIFLSARGRIELLIIYPGAARYGGSSVSGSTSSSATGDDGKCLDMTIEALVDQICLVRVGVIHTFFYTFIKTFRPYLLRVTE